MKNCQSLALNSCFSFLQLNQMTSWIDASFVYSTKEAWVNAMRTFRNGTFKVIIIY